MRNQVTVDKCEILDDNFQVLSLQRKMFSQRTLNDIMGNDFTSLEYFVKLLRRGPDVFTQFIAILIETKQNDIVNTTQIFV